MIIRKSIFKKFKWLKEKQLPFIISADYDGLICASFLSHYLNWELVGYYNMKNIWISNKGIKEKNSLIWVDLNIVPKAGKAIGGHINILDDEIPKGLESSCNPNLLKNISNQNFQEKYPLSTLSFLMWLFNTKVPSNKIAQFLILHSDATWLESYNWDKLFNNINSYNFEKEIDQIYYPMLIRIGAVSGLSKIVSSHLKITSREFQFNPDWDIDIILNLFNLFGKYLSWDPPQIPNISSKINGKKNEIDLKIVQKSGLKNFIKHNKVFSYAITSPKKFKYTDFDKIQ